MKIVAHTLAAVALVGASVAHAHPGHPDAPGLSHGQTHALIGILAAGGILVAALAATFAVRALKQHRDAKSVRQESRRQPRD